jgi:hypothetical protein
MFNKKPSIEFVSTINGILSINECLPKPYTNFIPKWWADKKIDPNIKSIKNCPSFPEFFSEAYVIPMWADTTFYVDGDRITIDTPRNDFFGWEFHPRQQFLDFAPKNISEGISQIAKASCPWNIITPKGYSVYQLPAFFDFNENFEVMAGTIRTDIHHQVNQQLMIKKKDHPYSFTIKRGDPLAIYIPYKREKFNYSYRYTTEKDEKRFGEMDFRIFSKFSGGYKNYIKEING